jgi:multidrug resistance protein, MATE family
MPSFLQQFVQLAIVNILSNLMVPLAGLIDTAFLGHLSEIRYLAGVALATVIFNYVYWTFGFLRISTTGMTAQALGRGDRDAVWLIALRHMLLGLGLGIVILIMQVPLRSLGFALLSATAEVKAAGQAYYNALIWGAPATLIGFVLVGWFLGRGQGGKVLLLSVVSSGSNVLFDYLFIVQWGWGSAGAGWATALSQYLLLLVGADAPTVRSSCTEGSIQPQWRDHGADAGSGHNFLGVYQSQFDPGHDRAHVQYNHAPGDYLCRLFH